MHPATSPSRGGGSAKPRRMRWESFVCAAALPLQGAKQIKITSPQKGADHQIWSAPSIYGRYSMATNCKFGTPVSGGAYQDARKVTIEWNAKLKYRDSPEFRRRLHQTHPSAPFLPYLFRQDGKDRAVGDNQQSQIYDNLSVSAAPRQLPFQGSQGVRTAGGSQNWGTAFQSASLTASLPLLSLRDISP